MSKHTVKAYQYDLKHFEKFMEDNGITDVEDATYDFGCEYLKRLKAEGLSPASINRRIAGIRTYINYLIDSEIIMKYPGFLLLDSLRHPFKLPRFLSEDEMIRLLESVNEVNGRYRGGFDKELWETLQVRDRCLLELAYATGCRISEIIHLEISDINFNQSTIRVLGKGGNERIVPFGRFAKYWMMKYKETVRPILKRNNGAETKNRFLLTRNGRPMSRIAAFNIVKRAGVLAGLSVTPHSIRHSTATHLMDRGVGIDVLAQLLGHKSFNTTQIYLHVSIERLHRTLKIHHPRYNISEVNMKYKKVEGDPDKLRRINTHLRIDQIHDLNLIAEKERVDRSQLIREAVSEKIEKMKSELKV